MDMSFLFSQPSFLVLWAEQIVLSCTQTSLKYVVSSVFEFEGAKCRGSNPVLTTQVTQQ